MGIQTNNSVDSAKRPDVLVVDDESSNIAILSKLLSEDYRVRVATNGKKALELAFDEPPSLVLLDIMMPEMNGYEVCRQLKEDKRTANIPILFLSAKSSIEDEKKGLSLGAVDFIHKPINAPIVKARVNSQLQAKSWSDFLQNKNSWLVNQVAASSYALDNTNKSLTDVICFLAGVHDDGSENHIIRTREYMRTLASAMAKLPSYAADLPPDFIEILAQAAMLHDVGKMMIPEGIIFKQGKLTPEEFEVIKTHSVRGEEVLLHIESLIQTDSEYFQVARQIVRYHHERWNGSGYPDGLHGEKIPLSARLMGFIDVYDALTTHRYYKEAMPHDAAMELLDLGTGKHFDPIIMQVGRSVEHKLVEIAEKWPDNGS